VGPSDWSEPIKKGQVILVAIGLYAATVAEVLESDVANDHVRSRIVGAGWTFGALGAICYALIAAVERNHNQRWNVCNGTVISFLLFAGAVSVTWGWAQRRMEEHDGN
jgi:hypothetical protein